MNLTIARSGDQTDFMNFEPYATFQYLDRGYPQANYQSSPSKGVEERSIVLQGSLNNLDVRKGAKESRLQTHVCPFEGCHQSFFDYQQLADHVEASQHGDFRCEVQGCGKNFLHTGLLHRHAWQEQHPFKCKFSDCSWVFDYLSMRENHQSHPHSKSHRPVEGSHPLACIECGEILAYQAQLQAHGKSEQHNPFQCICGTKFARLDVLHRHMDLYGSEMPEHPCNFCKRHRGRRGFKRRDHLVQHLQGYHKFDADESTR